MEDCKYLTRDARAPSVERNTLVHQIVEQMRLKRAAPQIDIDLCCAMLVHDTASEVRAWFSARLQDSFTNEQFLSHFLPTIAKKLGDLWVQDKISFAETTLAFTTLHQILRDNTNTLVPPTPIHQGQNSSRLLMLLPANEQHQFGLGLLRLHLQRAGMDQDVLFAPTIEDIVRHWSTNAYGAIGLSCAGTHSMDMVTDMLKQIRDVLGTEPHVIVGGYIKTQTHPADWDKLTNLITNDPSEVIKLLRYSGTTRHQDAMIS